MKHIININLSKDTPTETLTALSAALKPENGKSKRKQPLYALNEDIEKLHERYEQLFKQVKTSLNLSQKQIENECETLSLKYYFELEEISKLRKVEYDKQQAQIKARQKEETPWRRCWLWRLLFQPLTNRAQDIIEERAALDADFTHTAAEDKIKQDRKKLPSDGDKKLSKRELKRKMRNKLKEAIKQADKADTNEAFEEPPAVQVQENANAGSEPAQEPPQAQLRMNELPPMQKRRPRPPKSCRK